MRRVALSPDHVREYGFLSTPLTPTERRADHRREQIGTEQTEIDALATPQPNRLREIADEAILPFFDTTPEQRVRNAREAWLEEAQARLPEQTDSDEMARLQEEAEAKLADLGAEIDALNDAMRLDRRHLTARGRGHRRRDRYRSRWLATDRLGRLLGQGQGARAATEIQRGLRMRSSRPRRGVAPPARRWRVRTNSSHAVSRWMPRRERAPR